MKHHSWAISSMAPLGDEQRTVVVPSERYPLAATDLYQVLETSDVPAGVINIVTGERATLLKTLAEHDDVDGLWVSAKKVPTPKLSTGNLAHMLTWACHGLV
jgi:aldehyde dehydrogenase (NAD+)